jgi:hypothetical protein
VENSQLSRADKRLWKRVWWTLFTRDRSVAVALGRPVMINTDDADVEMISEDDFIEDDTEAPAEYEHSPVPIRQAMRDHGPRPFTAVFSGIQGKAHECY